MEKSEQSIFEQIESDAVYEVLSIRKVSRDCYELQFLAEPSFFVSERYLPVNFMDSVEKGTKLSGEVLETVIESGFAYVAEKDAFRLLERAEQCRFGLRLKLLKKGHNQQIIDRVLDLLESEKYLSDSRFAGAWIRNRMIGHTEGRSKLYTELMARGIDKTTATTAIDEYFENVSEREVFEKACKKFTRLGYDESKMRKKLLSAGFSTKLITEFLSK